jgi:hypothetical protein
VPGQTQQSGDELDEAEVRLQLQLQLGSAPSTALSTAPSAAKHSRDESKRRDRVVQWHSQRTRGRHERSPGTRL